MVALIKTLQVILALSLLIFIHELGHFMWAKIFHIRVEKFYLFFDIGGKALLKFRKGETEFGIGWLPLGGYCKIAGMIDESMDMEQMKQDPQPWEFRSHPAWQRLLVMAGGVLNNFIFAIIAFMIVMGIWGEARLGVKGNKIYPGELAEEMGFRKGDEILKLDDYVPENFWMIQADMARRGTRYATVLRDGDTLQLYIDHAMLGDIVNAPLLFDIALPFVVDSVQAGSPNTALTKGDHVLAINGESFDFVQDSREILAGLKGSEAEALLVRGADTLTVPVKVDTAGRIGVILRMPDVERREYSFLEAIPAGWKTTWSTVGGYIRDLKLLATPSTGAYKSVGSFIAIGQIFPSSWDWFQFMNLLALLSIMLAVMNLLPIPALDGGHIVFTLFEMISGRKPSDKFMAAMQILGLVLIFALMLLAFGNDITRFVIK